MPGKMGCSTNSVATTKRPGNPYEHETSVMLNNYIGQFDYFCQMNPTVVYSICNRSKLSNIFPNCYNNWDEVTGEDGIMGHAFAAQIIGKKMNYMVCRTVSMAPAQRQSSPDLADSMGVASSSSSSSANDTASIVPESPEMATELVDDGAASVVMCIRPGRNTKRKFVKIMESDDNGIPKRVRLICSPGDIPMIKAPNPIATTTATATTTTAKMNNPGGQVSGKLTNDLCGVAGVDNCTNTTTQSNEKPKAPLRKRGRKPLDINHKCDSFPVMLGSKLDRLFNDTEFMRTHNNVVTVADLLALPDFNYSPIDIADGDLFDWSTFLSDEQYRRTYNNPELLKYVMGCFIIRGQICILPNTLINNREWLHNFRNPKQDTVRLFPYDREKRGHKFELNLDPNSPLVTKRRSERELVTKLNLLKRNRNAMINALFAELGELTQSTTDDDIIKHFDCMVAAAESKHIASTKVAGLADGVNSVAVSPTSTPPSTLTSPPPTPSTPILPHNFGALLEKIDQFVQIEISKFIYRDNRGINHLDVDTFRDNIENLLPYETSHIDITKDNMIAVMLDSLNMITDIDSFKNKLVLGPSQLLFRFFDTYDTTTGIQWKSVENMLVQGNLQPLISRKIIFEVVKADHNKLLSKTERLSNSAGGGGGGGGGGGHDTTVVSSSVYGGGADSNIWKKPLVNQIADTPKMLMTIHKPKGKNVKNPNARNIPDDFTFFICPYVLGNLGNMGSNPSLVYDVVTSMLNVNESIIRVINSLLRLELIVRAPFGDTHSLIVNGMPWALKLSARSIGMAWIEFMVLCKKLEKFCHVTRTDKFVYFYFTHGIPMKPIHLNAFDCTILCSPIELSNYFADQMQNADLPRLSLIALPHAKKFSYYASFPKVVVSTNSSKLMLPTSHTAPLHKIISGGTSAHLIPPHHAVHIPAFDNEPHTPATIPMRINADGTVQLRTLFADFGMFNVEDTYIINSKLLTPMIMQHYANIEFVIDNNKIQIIPFERENRIVYTYDKHNNKKDITLYVCKIIAKRPIVPHPYAKLSRHSTYNSRDKVYIYTVYKCISYTTMLLLPSFDDVIVNVSYKRMFEYNEKLNITVHIVYKIPRLPATKLCNSWGQKGICVAMDLSNVRDDFGNEPDVITSAHSFLGREVLGQFKEMAMARRPDISIYNENQELVESGGFNGDVQFFFIANYSGEIKNFNTPKRIDRMSSTQLAINNVHCAMYAKQQDTMPTKERNYILSNRNRSVLCTYAVQKTDTVFENDVHRYDNLRRVEELAKLQVEYDKIINCPKLKCNHSSR